MARSTATQACFIDVEACTLRVFDAIRRPLAIGHDGSDPDRVLHLRFEFAARRAVIANVFGRLTLKLTGRTLILKHKKNSIRRRRDDGFLSPLNPRKEQNLCSPA